MLPAFQIVVGLLVLQAASAAATTEEEVMSSSLATDSECQGDDSTCALNALQVQQRAASSSQEESSADEALDQEEVILQSEKHNISDGLGISLASSCSWVSSTSSLIKCADDTVSRYASQISSNLRRQGIYNLDLAWPGTGFNQAAYGGQWQVLAAVQRRGGFKVENIVGASGGASSAILALVDRSRSARTMMDVLLSSSWGSVSTSGEYSKYKSLMQSGAWSDVQRHGYASVVCDSKSSVTYIVHDFISQEQAAKAFAASGDIPSIAFGNGYSLGGHLSHCHDTGELMGIGSNPLLYYNTDYGYSGSCSKSCALSLFKKGVQATVSALVSSSLQVGASGGGSIAIQKPRGSWTLTQYRSYKSRGGFWDILAGAGSSSQRVFVRGKSLSGGGNGWR